jgi:hypothetical protein
MVSLTIGGGVRITGLLARQSTVLNERRCRPKAVAARTVRGAGPEVPAGLHWESLRLPRNRGVCRPQIGQRRCHAAALSSAATTTEPPAATSIWLKTAGAPPNVPAAIRSASNPALLSVFDSAKLRDIVLSRLADPARLDARPAATAVACASPSRAVVPSTRSQVRSSHCDIRHTVSFTIRRSRPLRMGPSK